MADTNKDTEIEIHDRVDKLVVRVHELETENLTLKEENIELMENAEQADNPQKYQMIEGKYLKLNLTKVTLFLAQIQELSAVLDERQTQLDDKDEIMRTVQERNDQIAELKVELETQIEQRQALQDQIDQANREKYEFASERSGSPPGKSYF